MKRTTIISGGPLLCDVDTLHRDGLVAFKAQEIIYAGPASGFEAPEDAEIIDANGGLIMPGLINTHCHGPMTLFRGLADDLPLEAWLNEHMFPAEAMWVTEEMTEQCTLLACAEMLSGGITTVCDTYFCMNGAAKAYDRAGMRAVVCHGVIDFPAPGIPDPAKKMDVVEEFVLRWKGKSPLITPGLFAHSTYTCSSFTLRTVANLAAKLGVMWQTHLSETGPEVEACKEKNGCTPPKYLQNMGLLNSLDVAVHCSALQGDDIDLLAEAKVGIASCPESNMKLASGRARLSELIKARVKVGLGTDGAASNNDLDLFGEMRLAALMAKVFHKDPAKLPATEVLHCATGGGAAVLGLSSVCGSLFPGKQADVIVLRADQPHLQPMYNPVSQAVYAANGGDVRHVFVAGRQLVDDGELTSIDLDAARAAVRELAAKVRP